MGKHSSEEVTTTNLVTNKINVLRVSKTSFKEWVLYGAVDQALKTSCQADAVKVIPIHLQDVHGEPVDLELWINAEEAQPFEGDELNPPAQVILEQIELDKQGITFQEAIENGYEPPKQPLVKGVAILTGAGLTDFPEEHRDCIVAALVGQHPSGGVDE